MTKRLFDILASLAVLIALSPVLLLTALAVALESGRPVLFRQVRLGRGGREFGMYKFRSMVKDAAAIGPYHTSANDPRITRVGRFIRRTSIDELPQLFNVLLGDMSVVGPRPVRPGITGLAQATLRSAATESQRLELDLRYVREQGLWLDLRIIGWTLGRLRGQGSN